MSKRRTQVIRDYYIRQNVTIDIPAEVVNQASAEAELDRVHLYIESNLFSWAESTKAVSAHYADVLTKSAQILLDSELNSKSRRIKNSIKAKHYLHNALEIQHRESLWVRAIQNLYKRINFLQLNADLLSSFITEQEFEQEIAEQEEKYVVTFQELRNQYEAQIINDMVCAVGMSLDTNEVAELFGVEPDMLYAFQATGYSLEQHNGTVH